METTWQRYLESNKPVDCQEDIRKGASAVLVWFRNEQAALRSRSGRPNYAKSISTTVNNIKTLLAKPDDDPIWGLINRLNREDRFENYVTEMIYHRDWAGFFWRLKWRKNKEERRRALVFSLENRFSQEILRKIARFADPKWP